ncbi:MAG: M4 family metallopeptidase, partial [Chloroflexi bacterium]|nr:M4 family metallopeptidase [Chloroflexota bacterium]
DCDNAHDFAGATYDYYRNTHGRDSYDGRGATMISTVHYGRSYCNAFWTSDRGQTVYGDGFPVKDVVAHEWTHAVTQHSANLEYRWQSGALNESFSDIFGAMVDRDDWLMGEGLPPNCLGGREAIRDLSNPPRFGQPDHTSDWVSTCSDNEGVHTNSGIPNKAYYNIATAIGKDKAERIFYRTLVIYLQSTSSLKDARAAALRSTQDLYGSNSTEYNAVRDGFNAVGLDGVWQPPPNDCVCAARTTLLEKAYPDRLAALQVVTTLSRTRDQLLNTTSAGQHYRTLYYRHTGRITYLVLRDAELRAMGQRILHEVTPGLNQLLDGKGEQTLITHEVVTEVTIFLKRLAEADKGGPLAQAIEQEMKRVDLQGLAGMTFEEAWKRINNP